MGTNLKGVRFFYLDGLRTIFCIIVIISHFLNCFHPNAKTLFYNDGNYSVLFFFVLSGFLVNYSTCNTKNNLNVISSIKYIMKRYLRLLPVVFIAIGISGFLFFSGVINTQNCAEIAALPSKSRLYDNYLSSDIVSVFQIPYEAFIGAFISRPYLNPPFWTIRYELFGVFVVWVLTNLIRNNRYRLYIYGFLFAGGGTSI